MGMMEQMIKAVLDKTISERYSHLERPGVVYAAVSGVQEALPWYVYTLTVLDSQGGADTAYPPIPGVRAKESYPAGATVAAAFAYGHILPVILGEVSL